MTHHRLNIEKFTDTAIEYIQTIMKDYQDLEKIKIYNSGQIDSYVLIELLIRALGKERIHIYQPPFNNNIVMDEMNFVLKKRYPDFSPTIMKDIFTINEESGHICQTIKDRLEKNGEPVYSKNGWDSFRYRFIKFSSCYLFHDQPISFCTHTFADLMIEHSIEPYYPWIQMRNTSQESKFGFRQKNVYPLYFLTHRECLRLFDYLFPEFIFGIWGGDSKNTILHYRDSALTKSEKIWWKTRYEIENMNLFPEIMDFAWQYDFDPNFQSQFFFYLGQCYACQDILP